MRTWAGTARKTGGCAHYLAVGCEPIGIAEFTELFLRQRNRIYALAYARLRDSMLAEDAVQETAIRLWKASPRLSFSSLPQEIKYISLTTCSAVQDMIKTHSCQKFVSLEALAQEPFAYGFDDIDSAANDSDSGGDPTYETVANKEAIAKACSLLEQVGAKYFAVLSFRGMGYADDVIAKSLNITVNDVRVLAYRGRKKLRKSLEKEGLVP